MLLTRSIRRKLAVLLTLVVIMLAGLAYSSLEGLAGYKRVVQDLDVTIREAPRSSDLLASFNRLLVPLAAQPAPAWATDEARRTVYAQQRKRFEEALTRVESTVDDYFHAAAKLQRGKQIARQNDEVHNALISELALLHRNAFKLEAADDREYTVGWLGGQIAKLSEIAKQAPRPTEGLIERLQAAEDDYRVHVRTVRITTVAVSLLLVLLVERLFRWIVQPVRKLATGARRVATGEYSTRITDVNSGDEMAELAEMFNRMTARFQRVLEEQQTEVRTRSQQLVQSARLADVGFLAAGIAHEVNNPLAAIGMASESLEWRMDELFEQATEAGATEDDLDAVKQYLQMIQTEAARVRELTQRMLEFARRSPESTPDERNLYDVAAIVSEVIDMIGHLKRYSSRQIEWNQSHPLRARVNASQIKQVILNLVTNALEAMDEGGTLRIDMTQRCDEIELTFADDGCGMSSETAEHIFDPFFTTKSGGSSGTCGSGDGEALADGKTAHTGTGLGLAISHRIVEDHAGSLRVSSRGLGQGSTFTLCLPEAETTCLKAA